MQTLLGVEMQNRFKTSATNATLSSAMQCGRVKDMS